MYDRQMLKRKFGTELCDTQGHEKKTAISPSLQPPASTPQPEYLYPPVSNIASLPHSLEESHVSVPPADLERVVGGNGFYLLIQRDYDSEETIALADAHLMPLIRGLGYYEAARYVADKLEFRGVIVQIMGGGFKLVIAVLYIIATGEVRAHYSFYTFP
jgi:hypothetical protein